MQIFGSGNSSGGTQLKIFARIKVGSTPSACFWVKITCQLNDNEDPITGDKVGGGSWVTTPAYSSITFTKTLTHSEKHWDGTQAEGNTLTYKIGLAQHYSKCGPWANPRPWTLWY